MRISATFIKFFLILSFLVVMLNIVSFSFDFYLVYFGYALLAIAFVWLFLIFRKQKAGFWFEFPKYVFLFLLLLVTVSSLKFDFINNISFLKAFIGFLESYQMFLTIATIAIGALVFWMNRDVVGEIEKEKEDEEKAEKRRYEEFDKRFPRLARIWGLRSVVRWVYGEGWWYVAGLILVILIFINLTLPYYGNNIIESPNYSKFRTYLPGVINSYQQGNFFHYENNFYGNIENYSNRAYPSFPFYEWILFPGMFLIKYIPFLLLVRYLLTFLDIIIIVSFYFLLKKTLNKYVALFGALFLSVNTFLHNFFFITVLDMPALLFMLIGIILYLNGKKLQSYLFVGFSILMKDSFLIIILPLILILILTDKIKNKDKLMTSIKFIILALLPYTVFSVLIKKVPLYSLPKQIFLIFFGVSLITAVYLLFRQENIDKYIINKFTSQKILFIPFLVLPVPIIVLLYKRIVELQRDFLPDFSILFKWEMYYLIFKQMENYFPEIVWLFVFLGLISIFIYRKKSMVILAFILSVLSYVILSSKGVFFHNYYRHVLVLLFILIVCSFFQAIMNFSKKKFINVIIVLILVLTFANLSYDIYDREAKRLSMTEDHVKGFSETVDFLKEIVKPNERIIGRGGRVNQGLILLSFRSPATFGDTIRSQINNFGFSETMKNYNVTYYVSEGKSDFRDLLYLFEPISQTLVPSRSEAILYRISGESMDKYGFQFVDLTDELTKTTILVDFNQSFNKYRPDKYFELEKIIGDFYVYKII